MNTANLTSWRPGQSGNPLGRPKGFGALIREKTRSGRELVNFALRVMRGKVEGFSSSHRFEAMKWLPDRGWGPIGPIAVEDESDATNATVSQMSPDELVKRRQELLERQ